MQCGDVMKTDVIIVDPETRLLWPPFACAMRTLASFPCATTQARWLG
jgi:hypothetical protein